MFNVDCFTHKEKWHTLVRVYSSISYRGLTMTHLNLNLLWYLISNESLASVKIWINSYITCHEHTFSIQKTYLLGRQKFLLLNLRFIHLLMWKLSHKWSSNICFKDNVHEQMQILNIMHQTKLTVLNSLCRGSVLTKLA